MKLPDIRKLLKDAGLKVTPQRLAVMESFYHLGKHPAADKIIEYVRKNNPNIGTGTVYNVLEIFVQKGIIRRVNTEKDIMKYDHITEKHHHLYSLHSDRIEDYGKGVAKALGM